MVWELTMERGHHLLKAPLVVGHFIGGREAVADAQRFEMFFELRRQDVPQGHGGRPDLRSHDLESARDAFGGVGDFALPRQVVRDEYSASAATTDMR